MSYRVDAYRNGVACPADRAPNRRPPATAAICLAVLIVVLTAALTVVPVGPAAAQEGGGTDGSTPTSQPPTSETPTTQASTSSSTSSSTTSISQDTTTVPSADQSSSTEPTTPDTTGASSSSTSSNPSSTLADDTTTTSANGDTEADPAETVDPLIGEAPADDPLDPNVTVPPPSGAGADGQFAPSPVLWSSVRQAETKWADALGAKVEAIVEVRTLRLRAKELAVQQRELEDRTQFTIEELAAATERLEARAVRGFVQSSSGNATGPGAGADIFRSRDIVVSQRKNRLINAAVRVDQVSLAELSELRAKLGSSALDLVKRTSVIDASIVRAEAGAVELNAAVEQAKIELEAFKAGSDIYVDGVVFPIAGPYSVPLINSFGFPRMPGTPDAHSHQGIDIFAPRGTPLVAAERGVIGRVGDGRLGGLKFWLRGESGADWYYAHLDGFAPGLHNGQVVEAGQLLGYVGNTGNAIGTPPHLHLEIHPNGGAAVNPYPLLKVVSDLDLNAFVEGAHPGFRYQPVVSGRSVDVTTTSSTEPPTTSSTESPPTSSSSTTGAAPAPTQNSDSTSTTKPSISSTTGSPPPTTATAPSTTAPSTTAPSTTAGGEASN